MVQTDPLHYDEVLGFRENRPSPLRSRRPQAQSKYRVALTYVLFYRWLTCQFDIQAECSKLEQLGVSFAAGYIAGVFCAIVSHPADSVVSKLNQYSTRPPVGQILREMGPVGIWRGLGMRIFMIGTLTALQWFMYDTFKVYVGLPTTGAAPPAEKPAETKH